MQSQTGPRVREIHRPAAGPSQTIGRHFSDLTRFLQRQTEGAAFALPVRRASLSERAALARFGCHGERGARAYKGVWRQSPSGVQGQSPWSGGQGAKPPEAERFF